MPKIHSFNVFSINYAFYAYLGKPKGHYCDAQNIICVAQIAKEATMFMIRTISEHLRRHRAYMEARRELERL